VHQDVATLADAKRAVGCLVFDGGISPAIEVNYVRSGGKVQANHMTWRPSSLASSVMVLPRDRGRSDAVARRFLAPLSVT